MAQEHEGLIGVSATQPIQTLVDHQIRRVPLGILPHRSLFARLDECRVKIRTLVPHHAVVIEPRRNAVQVPLPDDRGLIAGLPEEFWESLL
jgi:hypothetical protein